MAFRIVSIENPAEVHVRDGQLVVIQDKGTASIPVKDIKVLIVSGPSIRMSTMAQTILANNKNATLFLGRNHHPAAMLPHQPQLGLFQYNNVWHAFGSYREACP